MTRPSLYLETIVIGHLAGRIHSDPVVADRQIATRGWWAIDANWYQLFVSDVVAEECGQGEPVAAAERQAILDNLIHFVRSQQSRELANLLIAEHAIPATELRDAAHISLATVNKIQCLLTWNFKHIANPATKAKIESICHTAGYESPIICSPDLLIGV